MRKFTVEEINFMCVFETQDRTDMIRQIRQVMPHIKDSDMEELGEQVLGKLQSMTEGNLQKFLWKRQNECESVLAKFDTT